MATTTTISALVALAAASRQQDDVLPIVDVHDFTQGPSGSTKKITVANLFTNNAITGTLSVSGVMSMNGVNRVLGTGAAAGTVSAFRFGDTNSASSRDWSISDGYGGGATAIGALVFGRSTVQGGDPIAGTEVLRLDSGGNMILAAAGQYKLTPNGTSARFVIVDANASYTGKLVLQGGAGSSGFGGAINLYGHSHATNPGDIAVGISSGSGGKFRVNTQALDAGTDVFTVDATGVVTAASTITAAAQIGVVTSAGTASLQTSSVGGSGRDYRIQSTTAGAWNVRDASAGADRFTIAAGGAATLGSSLTIGGAFLPSTTATYDLGATGTRWSSLYLSAGLIAAGSASVGTTLAVTGLSTLTKIKGGGSAPGVVAGGQAGTGATTSITGTDVAGKVTVNTGTGPTAGGLATITFNVAYATTPYVQLSSSGGTGTLTVALAAVSTTGFSIITSNGLPTASSTYDFFYLVVA